MDDTNVKKCEKSANVCKNVEKFYTPYMNILNIKMIMVKVIWPTLRKNTSDLSLTQFILEQKNINKHNKLWQSTVLSKSN